VLGSGANFHAAGKGQDILWSRMEGKERILELTFLIKAPSRKGPKELGGEHGGCAHETPLSRKQFTEEEWYFQTRKRRRSLMNNIDDESLEKSLLGKKVGRKMAMFHKAHMGLREL